MTVLKGAGTVVLMKVVAVHRSGICGCIIKRLRPGVVERSLNPLPRGLFYCGLDGIIVGSCFEVQLVDTEQRLACKDGVLVGETRLQIRPRVYDCGTAGNRLVDVVQHLKMLSEATYIAQREQGGL